MTHFSIIVYTILYGLIYSRITFWKSKYNNSIFLLWSHFKPSRIWRKVGNWRVLIAMVCLNTKFLVPTLIYVAYSVMLKKCFTLKGRRKEPKVETLRPPLSARIWDIAFCVARFNAVFCFWVKIKITRASNGS